jgi:hypothetical protein
MTFSSIPFTTLYDKLIHLASTNAAIATSYHDIVKMLTDPDVIEEFPAAPAIDLFRSQCYGTFHGMKIYMSDNIKPDHFVIESMMTLL